MKQPVALLCNFFSKLNNKTQISKLTLFVLLTISAPNVYSANPDNKDSDGDGLSDLYEEKIGTEAYLSDTDGDGVKDGIEVGKNLNKPLNSDNDKRIDALDYDDDNDGLPTFLETKNDSDKDGIKDYLDPDSDNDGLVDGQEAGALNQDKNLDGIDDAFDSARPGAIDKNGDGIDDNLKLPDHNNDGLADYLDASYKKQLDIVAKPSKKIKPEVIAKNITKEQTPELPTSSLKEIKKGPKKVAKVNTALVEKKLDVKSKQKTKPKVDVNRYTDTDNDGLLDSQEIILGTNIMKRDSDGDKVSDAIEIGMDINSPQDSDHDGIIDALDNDDDNDGVLTKDEDINKDSTAINDDTDQDGVPNYLDANDDGDSRLTKAEGSVKDSDNDGILDYLDKNDGVMDKALKVAAKEKIPDEPEVVVLFDGNISSLPKQEDDLAEQVIESTVSKSTLKDTNQTSEKSSETQSLNSQKVVIRENANKPKSEKEKGGIMQWLTSLLPD